MKHLLSLPIAFPAFQFADGQDAAAGATRGGATVTSAAATPRKPLARTMKEYAKTGSISIYYSGYNSPDHYNNTNSTVELFKTNRESSLDDFKNGGSVRLRMEPQNTDNWNVTQITLTLNFSGSMQTPEVITFTGVPRIDNRGSGTSDVLLYFNSNFKQR